MKSKKPTEDSDFFDRYFNVNSNDTMTEFEDK